MQTDFLKTLHGTYGPVMNGRAICKVLHYPSAAALQAAKARGKLPFRTVEFEGRKGLFASTADVAQYLEQKFSPSPHLSTNPHSQAEVCSG